MKENTQNRKDQLVKEATKLIAEKGYTSTTMRDIAEASGIEAASIYNHFESKEQILKEICFSMANQFVTAEEEVNDIYFDAEQKLRMAVKNHIEILTKNPLAAKVFLYEWRHLNENVKADFIKLRDQYEEGFKDIIKTGEDEHVFKITDRKFAVLTILSSLNWITEWYKADGTMKPDEIADKLTSFVLNGLQKEKLI